MQAREEGIDWPTLENLCNGLIAACETADYPTVKDLLETYVSGYKMADETFDLGFAQSRRTSPGSATITRLDERNKH
jgi:hypothetical protein